MDVLRQQDVERFFAVPCRKDSVSILLKADFIKFLMSNSSSALGFSYKFSTSDYYCYTILKNSVFVKPILQETLCEVLQVLTVTAV